MMVFEYAPSGSLFEHLHVKEMEHLDWNARMRAIMGVAYCLQYVHELNPPVALGSLQSNSILLTDDYAAKVADIGFRAHIAAPKSKISGELEPSVLSANADAETNIYNFGLPLLEIITGKLTYSEKQGPLLNWEIVSKLREVIAISPEAATLRLSPLWWAELEILSVETT